MRIPRLKILLALLLAAASPAGANVLLPDASVLMSEDLRDTVFAMQFVKSSLATDENPRAWKLCLKLVRKLTKEMRRVRGGKLRVDNFRVLIYRVGVPGAFSLPGGTMIITSGLLKWIDSEDALAGVIGHEMAHAELGHAERRRGRIDPTLGVLSAIHSREAELEADRLGIQVAVGSGYSAAGLKEFLNSVTRMHEEQGGFLNPVFSTHPHPESRIEEINAGVRNDRPPTRSTALFRSMKKWYETESRAYLDWVSYHDAGELTDSSSRPELERIKRSLETGIDLQIHERDARNLLGRKSLKPADRARVRVVLAGILDAREKIDEALNELGTAEKEAPELKVFPWIRIRSVLRKEDSDAAAGLWRDSNALSYCGEDVRCLSLAYRSTKGLELPWREVRPVARKIVRMIRKSGKVGKRENAALAAIEGRDILENLRLRRTSRDKMDFSISGYRGAPAVEDIRKAEAHYDRVGRLFGEYKEYGTVVDLGGGGSFVGGPLREALSDGASVSFEVGYRWYPVELGFSMVNYISRTVNWPGGAENTFGTFAPGGYFKYILYRNTWRPYLKAAVSAESLKKNESFGDDTPDTATGISILAHAGISYGLTSGRFGNVNLKLATGPKWMKLSSFDGNRGHGLAWDVLFSIEMFFGKVERDSEMQRLRSEPAAFF